MLRHVVLFTWSEDATEEQRATVAAKLGELPGIIPQIKSYVMGKDAGVSPGTVDFALVADFDSAEDFLTYRNHPAHQAVITEHINPILAGRSAIQYTWQG
ncbi:Dabb family protein [Sinosporangium siamense]|uniref:Stress-response A/B barrel domain-containing protein n=1 Tax=Sinosporangium siamense TaxID=1367973 RepID=A0A919VFL1_9ACTN|nr:Dabb family protein [Sinosporangium siamense]GII96229.1 hypothetical protein Ssi02_64600 [Sinosporangium siamense]